MCFLKNVSICHRLQSAYQSKLCSLMISFNLQETIAHFTERGSKVYCSLLDAKSAFDSVWHDGLFVKLFKLGINRKMWRLLRPTYNRMYGCVCHDGLMSQWFKLNQSVQGGVLSTWLYLVYINDLATELKKAELCATIDTFYMGTPIYASRRCRFTNAFGK